jgi:hypothetical protein
MNDLQSEHFFEGIEIAIEVQQGMALLQTKCSDETVDGRANCVSSLA